MPERVILSIGTKKGLFVAEASKTRGKFALRGPFSPGVAVYSALIDTRGTPRLYASSCNAFFGMKVLRSTDLGKTFQETKSAPAFPKDDGRALANIWSLEAGEDKKDLWCGVEPAALFRSRDSGDSWEMVPGISNHEHARKWQPGNGGLCLHTILRDGNARTPRHLDRGPLPERRRRGHLRGLEPGRGRRLQSRSLPRVRPVRAQDRRTQGRAGPALHAEPRRLGRMGRAGGAPAGNRGTAQRRSRPYLALDRQGAALRFRLPPRGPSSDPDTVYVVPLEPATRTCPGGVPAVWRSEDGGGSWSRLTRGLPKKESFFTVQRDAMDIDELKSPALYFGTTTGQLWMGRDGGEEWSCLFDSLPPIHCVKVAVA